MFFRRKKNRNVAAELSSELAKQLTESGLFDADYYLLKNPDLERFEEGPLIHYLRHGMKEGREASPFFSVRTYLLREPSAGADELSAFTYALDNLERPGQRILGLPNDDLSFAYLLKKSELFDEAWYLERYKDVKKTGTDPFTHFLEKGAREMRDPSCRFNSQFYAKEHREYSGYFDRPIEYYLRFGFRLNHLTIAPPPYYGWLKRFDEITAADRAIIAEHSLHHERAVFGVQIVDSNACERIAEIIQSWNDQILQLSGISFVAAGDLTAEARAQCTALLKKHPRMAMRSAADSLSGFSDNSDIILCGGPVRLRAHAAYAFANTLALKSVQAVYCDHDYLDKNGLRSAPAFKPAMSPELMRQLPYAGDSIAVRLEAVSRRMLLQMIELTTIEPASHCWSHFMMRLNPAEVKRIPFVLFHVARLTVVSHEIQNRSLVSESTPRRYAGQSLAAAPALEIIIPSRDQPELLSACIGSIESLTEYPAAQMSITIVDNGSVNEAALLFLNEFGQRPRRKVVPWPEAFNFSDLCNQGAAATDAEILVFLNNDTTVRDVKWLWRLVEHAYQSDVGVVGAQLLYPDETVQHGGVVLGVQGVGAHRLVGVPAASAAKIDLTREMVAVTGACLAIRREVFYHLGRFDPALQIAFNDVDLCVRSHLAGYRNIYVAEPLLFHHESKSRGLDDTKPKRHRAAREAIYVRSRYQGLFRNDPFYSPNLSLDEIDELAVPPRSVRPWRRSQTSQKRILLLSITHELGHGVATVIQQQARVFRQRGWDVYVGGRPGKREISYSGCERVLLWQADDAAAFAVEKGIDCIVAHTPPFFSIVRYLGSFPLVYFYDHGEPPASMFPDFEMRETVDWEKRFCAPLASRVFTISRTIHRAQFLPEAIVLRNGNDHLARWRSEYGERRRRVRETMGVERTFVVLQVSRIGPGERFYKGIDRYGGLAQDVQHFYPEFGGTIRFLIAGKGDAADIEHCRSLGLSVFPNVSDDEMLDLYLACDLYVSLSEWEGYNLCIAQAQALGIDVLASDIEAHREFGVETSNSPLELCASVARRYSRWNAALNERSPVVEPWDIPLTELAEIIENDQFGRSHSHWESIVA